MKFLIITHVPHFIENNIFYAYSPYVREMNIWLKYVDEVIIVAPVTHNFDPNIMLAYNKTKKITFIEVPSFDIMSLRGILKTILVLPYVSYQIIKGMMKADHIHLRQAGNMGLLGSIYQIFFPNKKKTVKYAGSWIGFEGEPFTYKLQKFIVANSFLSRNLKVLAYGYWPNAGKNVLNFFTATYHKNEIIEVPARKMQEPLKLLFVGTLTKRKRPFFVLEAASKLKKLGINVFLEFYGEGPEKDRINEFIKKNNLSNNVKLYGNKTKKEIVEAYQNAHFLILPSNHEGWPKVVAEAMVWKCLPITTPVSAVPYMLGNGERGSLIEPTVEAIVDEIKFYLKNPEIYRQKVEAAHRWSKQFTLEKFEEEIKKLL